MKKGHRRRMELENDCLVALTATTKLNRNENEQWMLKLRITFIIRQLITHLQSYLSKDTHSI